MEGNPRHPAPHVDVLAQMADALAWPMLLLTVDAHLLYANYEGRLLLARKSALRLQGSGTVQAVPTLQQARFTRALTAAAESRQVLLHWPSPLGCSAVVQRLPGVDLPPERVPRHGHPAVLLLAMTMAAAGRADSLTFARAHQLTRAETRVLQRLVLGDSPDVIARHFDVAVATVRSQTAAIRRKTGHRSIAELVGAVARGSPASASTPPARKPSAAAAARAEAPAPDTQSSADAEPEADGSAAG